MKLVTVIMIATFMQVSASSFGQRVTFFKKAATIGQIFNEVRKQTGYSVLYSADVQVGKQDVNFQNASLDEVLRKTLVSGKFSYVIENRRIVIRKKEESFLDNLIAQFQEIEVRGRIMNETGSPLPGATVRVKETGRITTTDLRGYFLIQGVESGATLEISYVGYQTREYKAASDIGTVTLQLSDSKLDEIQVVAYGTVTKRLNTGSVGSVKAAEIERQPVTNPLNALQGKITGLNISQTSGVQGAQVKVQIRGNNSLINGSDPLFIIDGIPFATENGKINQQSSVATFIPGSSGGVTGSAGGISPFNLINPNDIESIEVLKDADATAIYGSRGGNGVILITTKKGKAGKTTLNATVSTGMSKVAKMVDMLNTKEYLQMRREAFKNDGVTPTVSNARDLMVWDTTRYTNWQKLLIGNTAHSTDASAAVSGGSENTQFRFSSAFHKETSVLAGDQDYSRASFNSWFRHLSGDGNFSLELTAKYTADRNDLSSGSVSGINLAPNAPEIYDANGKLNWGSGTGTFTNPFAGLLNTYKIQSDNLLSNLKLGYKVSKDLEIRASLGYNTVNSDERSQNPMAAKNPTSSSAGTASAIFSNANFKSYIAEPQIEYSKLIGSGNLNVLVGGTWQYSKSNSNYLSAQGYTNDALLTSTTGATTIFPEQKLSEYKYLAFFGRINYNWQEKYILNLTGRRDGSSRFGPGSRFNNFASLGVAWIFTNETWLKDNLSLLSFGKLRGTYGITGSDQIGDYKFLDTWSVLTAGYAGSSPLIPDALFNADFNWERNRKSEIALDLGFLKERLLLSSTYYRNRSNNQLIEYSLPSQTGFPSILRNFEAEIENSGFEFELNANLMRSENFNWTMGFNLTLPKTKLISFPGLETSSYANTYILGESTSLLRRFNSLGVDPVTGILLTQDINGNGSYSSLDDFVSSGNRDPKAFGGLSTGFSYKGVTLDLFFNFKNQQSLNNLFSFYGNAVTSPGTMFNQQSQVLERWTGDGDLTSVQRFSATTSNKAYAAVANYRNSNGLYSNNAFMRLRNAALSYQLPQKWISKLHLSGFRIYIQGQNLFTVAERKEFDPEMPHYLSNIPPLRTIVAGLQVSL